MLIDRYETEKFPVPEAKPAEVLRFLLDQNGLSQRDIAGEMGGGEYRLTGAVREAPVESGSYRQFEPAVSGFTGGFLWVNHIATKVGVELACLVSQYECKKGY